MTERWVKVAAWRRLEIRQDGPGETMRICSNYEALAERLGLVDCTAS